MAVGRKQLHINQRGGATSRNRAGGGGRNNPATRGTDARFKLRQNSIKVKKSGFSNEVKLYTSHFDARNKISGNRISGASSQVNGRGRVNRNDVVSPGTGNGLRRNGSNANRNATTVSRSATNNNINRNVNGGRRNNVVGNRNPVTQRNQGSHRMRIQFDARTPDTSKTVNTTAKSAKVNNVKSKTGYRESTFTGKSLRISTPNELAGKDRKAMVRGKTLSVTAKNKTEKGGRNKSSTKSIHKTIKMDNSRWIGPSITKQMSPEPVALPPPASSNSSSSKKSLSAKVVISNLHPNVTQEDIMELFGAIGPLRDGRIKNVGTAEVVYRVSEDAFAAYSKYHGRNLDGQPMILKITTADDAGGSSSRSSRYDTTSPSAVSGYHTSSSSNPPNTKPVVFTVKL